MWEVFKYSVVTGISRMLNDLEGFIEPVTFKLYPILRWLSSVNVWVVSIVFVAMLCYLLFIRHHHVLSKLKHSANYFSAGALLLIYVLVCETPLRIGPVVSINVGLFVMPLAAKLFGPVLAGAFGIIQYAASFAMHQGEAFDISSMLVAGISGMIYGRIIYLRKTTYLRCLWAKVLVNVVCNIMLVPMFRAETLTHEALVVVVRNISVNILLAPAQALLIFVALKIMKKIRKGIEEGSWGFAR
jgi:hypothetical protein